MAKAAKHKEENEQKPAYEVIRNFHDINDITKIYREGDDVSHFDQDRLDWLISADHVKKND